MDRHAPAAQKRLWDIVQALNERIAPSERCLLRPGAAYSVASRRLPSEPP